MLCFLTAWFAIKSGKRFSSDRSGGIIKNKLRQCSSVIFCCVKILVDHGKIQMSIKLSRLSKSELLGTGWSMAMKVKILLAVSFKQVFCLWIPLNVLKICLIQLVFHATKRDLRMYSAMYKMSLLSKYWYPWKIISWLVWHRVN